MRTSTIEEIYSVFKKHPVIVKDTREITKDCIFIALKGENFDANQFAEEALNKGAAYAIIDNPAVKTDDRFLLVDNVLESLQDLARMHRGQLKIPVIGITGSNGKTTNKELIYSVLSKKYKTLATQGNYNNHIGVPLTVLRIREDHEMAIIEMGANHQKEIEFLCTISNPDYCLITNIGKAHLEGFGGIEGVKKGKSELYRHIENKMGLTFINGDDPTLLSLSKNNKQIAYGMNSNNLCVGKMISESPIITGQWTYENQSGKINSRLFGKYNFYNIMAAICIGNYFEVHSEHIDKGIEDYVSSNNRSEISEFRGAELYLDAYNANPSSMEASINYFHTLESGEKILIIGDMYEIGEDTDLEHKRVIELAKQLGFKRAYFLGELFFRHKEYFPDYNFFESKESMKTELERIDLKAAKILVKASRGMALEKLFQ